jgi:hypothetical protein
MCRIAMYKMNEKYKLEYLEMKVTLKTVLFSRVESKIPYKLKPNKQYKGHEISLIRLQVF